MSAWKFVNKDRTTVMHVLDDGRIESGSLEHAPYLAWLADGYSTLPPDEPSYEQLLAECLNNRRAAYVAESDPLNFDYQRDEINKQVWLDKVAEIKLRYPKP